MPTDDVQVFIEDFDSTLEVIAAGTWDSGESLTVRLSNENLNTNTLTDQDMAIGDDALPVLIQGDPITLGTVEIARTGDATFGEEWSVNREYPSGNTEGNKYHHHVYRNTDIITAGSTHGVTQ